jgi:hypothetical protein
MILPAVDVLLVLFGTLVALSIHNPAIFLSFLS